MGTSVEHWATASANLSIGLVLPDISGRGLLSRSGKSKRRRSVTGVSKRVMSRIQQALTALQVSEYQTRNCRRAIDA